MARYSRGGRRGQLLPELVLRLLHLEAEVLVELVRAVADDVRAQVQLLRPALARPGLNPRHQRAPGSAPARVLVHHQAPQLRVGPRLDVRSHEALGPPAEEPGSA